MQNLFIFVNTRWLLKIKKKSRVTFEKNPQTKQTIAVLTIYKILANEPKREKWKTSTIHAKQTIRHFSHLLYWILEHQQQKHQAGAAVNALCGSQYTKKNKLTVTKNVWKIQQWRRMDQEKKRLESRKLPLVLCCWECILICCYIPKLSL